MFTFVARWLGLAGPLSAKKIDKAKKLAANPFAQPDVRMREMQRLLHDGSELALRALLVRLTVNAQGHIADEDEKRFLCDALVEAGNKAVAPLRAFIDEEERLTHALQTYVRIEGHDRAAIAFAEALAGIGPLAHRRLEAKLQLVLALGEYRAQPAVQEALIPHLLDHSDDVRIAVMDVLGRALHEQAVPAPTQARLAPALTRLVSDDGVSLRIAQRAADVLADGRVPLTLPAALHPSLADHFLLRQGRLQRAHREAAPTS